MTRVTSIHSTEISTFRDDSCRFLTVLEYRKSKESPPDRTSFETEPRRNCRGKLCVILVQRREKEEMRFRSEIHIASLKGKTKLKK